MYRGIFLCLLVLCANCAADAADLYTEINRVRAGDGRCLMPADLPPLQPNAALERAARNMARGDALQRSLDAAGYRPTHSSYVTVKGDDVGTRTQEALATASACRQLQDAAMSDVGVYVDARQLWIVLASPFAPAVRMSEPAAGDRVLDLVNRARATPRYCGDRRFEAARPLRWNDLLAQASERHADDMARNNYFSHNGRDGSNPGQRVERAGYRYRATGENIAAGTQMQAEDAVAGWIKSPGHCANLMNPGFTEMGAAFAVDRRSDMGIYWAQSFGAPR
ncbi:MAG: CAP domain-containing protein [Burkholderiales bacterium]